MTMLPGSPSVQNLIPTEFLGTDIYAAPFLGLLASAITFFLGYVYLSHAAKPDGEPQTQIHDESRYRPSDLLSLIPCAALWLLSFLLIRRGQDSRTAVEISMIVALSLCFAIGRSKGNVKAIINAGVSNGLKTLALTSSVMGYGAVVQKTDVFMSVSDALFLRADNPLLSSVLLVNALAAITGSSTTSLQMFFNLFSHNYISVSIPATVLHRVMTIASGGLDSMPYATGVIVATDLSKVPLARSYLHIFITCAVIPLIALAVLLILLAFA